MKIIFKLYILSFELNTIKKYDVLYCDNGPLMFM